MFILALTALTLGVTGPMPPLYCPATLEKITGKPAAIVEFEGIMFETCCLGCGNPLVKNPKPLLQEARKQKLTVGYFAYDPVSGLKIAENQAAGYTDYNSVRYFFATGDEKKSFDANPKSFASDVDTESYFCPVSKHDTNWKTAAAYADYNGVRYFLSSAQALKQFKADPSKYVDEASSHTKSAHAEIVSK